MGCFLKYCKEVQMKKLYRSKNDFKIAGVCGGLAEYFNVDPVIVRILFILLIPFGFIGPLAYLVMWAMVPFESGVIDVGAAVKRLYLSGRDRKIAGVCGGLGEYFTVDPTIFRVIFVISSFMGGAGILLYIILWLVMPRN